MRPPVSVTAYPAPLINCLPFLAEEDILQIYKGYFSIAFFYLAKVKIL